MCLQLIAVSEKQRLDFVVKIKLRQIRMVEFVWKSTCSLYNLSEVNIIEELASTFPVLSESFRHSRLIHESKRFLIRAIMSRCFLLVRTK